MTHTEVHRTQRVGSLRAAMLGANDGIVSTASLIVGVAAKASRSSVNVLSNVRFNPRWIFQVMLCGKRQALCGR